jgi:ribonuclease P protein component
MRRHRRLPGGSAFDAVFREGTVLNSPFFVVRVRPGPGPGTRWGVAVGKKLAPRAVDRNFLRRRIKSAFQDLDAGDWDAVVVAKAPAKQAAYLELARAANKVASRVRKAGTPQ